MRREYDPNEFYDAREAASAARAISRRLRAAGLRMADTSNRYHWTEGLHVHRVGVGRRVSVGYNFDNGFGVYRMPTDDELARRETALREARELLVKAEYLIEGGGGQINFWVKGKRQEDDLS